MKTVNEINNYILDDKIFEYVKKFIIPICLRVNIKSNLYIWCQEIIKNNKLSNYTNLLPLYTCIENKNEDRYHQYLYLGNDNNYMYFLDNNILYKNEKTLLFLHKSATRISKKTLTTTFTNGTHIYDIFHLTKKQILEYFE